MIDDYLLSVGRTAQLSHIHHQKCCVLRGNSSGGRLVWLIMVSWGIPKVAARLVEPRAIGRK